MGDSNAVELVRIGSSLFSKKLMLHDLWQKLAEEVYQARADFTHVIIDGDEYLKEQYESVPSQNRRDFASAVGALSRPKSQPWFNMVVRDLARNTDPAKAWLHMVRDKQERLLYTRRANFQRAMQSGDNDFVTFGNAVHTVLEDHTRGKIAVYDTHHLRDCAWFEDRSRQVNGMFRKWKLALSNWNQAFPGVKLPAMYETRAKTTPHEEIELWHVSVPVGFYDFYTKKPRNPGHKFASIYLDPASQTIIKEGANYEFPYLVRRWLLNDHSPYAHSPAAMYGLIDARLLQAESRVILEAGERVIDPPMIAKSEGVIGKINNYPGATNWVDANYDERQGEALRAIKTEANIPLGLEMKQDTRQVLAAAWYLNKLNLPSDKDMTAFEVNERISEYIRSIGPVIEPFQDDNALMLDTSFSMNLRLGNFGPMQMVPPELKGANVEFEFEGPMQIAKRMQKMQNAKSVLQWIQGVIASTQNPHHPALDNVDLDAMTRDVVEYSDGEPEWLVPLNQRDQGRQQAAQQLQQQQQAVEQAQQLHAAGQTADLAPKLAAANQAIPAITAGAGQNDGASDYPQPEPVNDNQQQAA